MHFKLFSIIRREISPTPLHYYFNYSTRSSKRYKIRCKLLVNSQEINHSCIHIRLHLLFYCYFVLDIGYIKHPIIKKSHRVAHENQRGGVPVNVIIQLSMPLSRLFFVKINSLFFSCSYALIHIPIFQNISLVVTICFKYQSDLPKVKFLYVAIQETCNWLLYLAFYANSSRKI